jgi:hypothetical protein
LQTSSRRNGKLSAAKDAPQCQQTREWGMEPDLRQLRSQPVLTPWSHSSIGRFSALADKGCAVANSTKYTKPFNPQFKSMVSAISTFS